MIVDSFHNQSERGAKTSHLTRFGALGRFFAIAIPVLSVFLAPGCASVGSPGGGPEDTLAPSVLAVFPEPFKTNFGDRQVEFEFDEYISLKNPDRQIFLSPPTSEKPKAELRGKRLIVKLPENLKPNTTYALHFGEALTDFTAGNPLKGFRYVFSTGAQIDSMEIRGSAMDALKKEPVSGLRVMIYRNDTAWSDSSIYGRLPDSYALTDDRGVFLADFLSPGAYRVAAWLDENSDFKYDPDKEVFAFVLDPVESEKADSAVAIRLQTSLAVGAARFKTARQKFKGRLDIPLSTPTTEVGVRRFQFYPENEGSIWAVDTLGSIDTLRIFYKGESLDSFQVVLTKGGIETDTLNITPRGSRLPPQNYAIELFPALQKPSEIRFEGRLPFRFDSLAHIAWVSAAGDTLALRDRPVRKTLNSFALSLPEGKPGKYKLYLEQGVCLDFFDRPSDSLEFDITIPTAEDRSELNIKFSVPEGAKHPRAELLRPDGSLVFSGAIDSISEWKLAWIEPGSYRLRAFEDENDNGQWDPVDWALKRQPEPLSLFTEAIELKANWEVELEWKPNFGGAIPLKE